MFALEINELTLINDANSWAKVGSPNTDTVPEAKIPNISGTKIAIDASGFDGNLATTDDTAQKVAQALDDLMLGTGGLTQSQVDARIATWARASSPSGTIPSARISLSASQIPSLDAGKITTGTFATARIASLDASKINSGTFDAARIPNLSANKITSGSMSADRIGSGKLTSARLPSISYNDLDDLPAVITSLAWSAITGKPASFTPNTSNVDARISTWARVNSPSGTIPDARIPASIARDSEITTAISGFKNETQIKGYIANWAETSNTDDIPASKIPDLNASKITGGTFAIDRIPILDDSKISGLAASKLTGTLADARIPSLNASKINAGTFHVNRIPNLPLSKLPGNAINTAINSIVENWAKIGNSTLIPIEKIPSTIARTSAIPSITGLLNASGVDARIASWARANSPSGTIPDSSIPASIARDAEIASAIQFFKTESEIKGYIADWAEDGNNSAIPDTKIPDLNTSKITAGNLAGSRITIDASRL